MTKTCLIAFILMACSCSNDTVTILTGIKKIDNYPSASGIEYFNNQFYIIGDDATQILVLDTNFNETDSIRLIKSDEKRLPKSNKPDLEAVTLLPGNKFLALGSGSLAPFRNKAWIIDPASRQVDSLPLDNFYARLAAHGLREINIEGLCRVQGKYILSNRGNLTHPVNHLIIAGENFWEQQTDSPITLIRLGTNINSTGFNGVSGLFYCEKSDKLLLTVSTEHTKSTYEDGAIGKSFLWVIDNFLSKLKKDTINPDTIIDLEKIDNRFLSQKIESVVVTEEDEHSFHLVLVADNDDGSSTLFKMIMEKGK